jgi:hypothetical protein
MTNYFPRFPFLLLFLAVALMPGRAAFALDKIFSPIVEEGELAIEYSGLRTFDGDPQKNNLQEHELEMEYGVNGFWQTEIEADINKDPGGDIRVDDLGWENIFQFTPQGKYWLDAGMLLTYGHALHHGDADDIETKLLLQKDWGKWLNIANIGLDQEVGRNALGGPDRSFIWSSRYRVNPYFNPGFEIQSDFGQPGAASDSFEKQQHYLGPAVYGIILPQLKYEAAWLAGVSDAAASSAARFKLEYEIRF